MAWRLANSLIELRNQVNAAYPKRSKDSDGSIGDVNHSARTSDHNPDDHGVVRAIDITHDPKGGFDSYAFADMMLKRQDPRLKYVISNRRIGSGPAGQSPGIWRPYNGTNPHNHHCHISCVADARGDDSRAWDIGGVPPVAPEVVEAHVEPRPTVKIGSRGPATEQMQRALGCKVTGIYLVNTETEWALKLAQFRHGLIPDGVCGPMTWAGIAPELKTG